MSHNPEKIITCPNCGFHAQYNYCAECGQETHLHKDTFVKLVTHFISHYFHYDSKFGQTIKALWFSPGKLTISYWKGQRMRYIPPISLYIFISAAFFILRTFAHHSDADIKVAEVHTQQNTVTRPVKRDHPVQDMMTKFHQGASYEKLQQRHPNAEEYIREQVQHDLPKMFFVMIPFMALLLKLLFRRRKDLYYADHSIFSLHAHSVGFSLFIAGILLPASRMFGPVNDTLYMILFVYIMIAMRKVYDTGWMKSFAYTLVISLSYLLAILCTMLTMVFLLVNYK